MQQQPPQQAHQYLDDAMALVGLGGGGGASGQPPSGPPQLMAPASQSSMLPVSPVVQFLLAMMQTPPGPPDVDGACVASFQSALAAVAPSVDGPDALTKLSSLQPEQFRAVFGCLDAAHREQFHALVLRLSAAAKSTAVALANAAAVLRLLLVRVLPAQSGSVEEIKFGSTTAVASDFGALERLAQWIRPDDANPRFQEAGNAAANANRALSSVQAANVALSQRLKQHGFDPEDAAKDALVIRGFSNAKTKTTVIPLIVVCAVLAILVVVIAIVAVKFHKKSRTGGGNSSGFNPAASGSGTSLSNASQRLLFGGSGGDDGLGFGSGGGGGGPGDTASWLTPGSVRAPTGYSPFKDMQQFTSGGAGGGGPFGI